MIYYITNVHHHSAIGCILFLSLIFLRWFFLLRFWKLKRSRVKFIDIKVEFLSQEAVSCDFKKLHGFKSIVSHISREIFEGMIVAIHETCYFIPDLIDDCEAILFSLDLVELDILNFLDDVIVDFKKLLDNAGMF
jgi:hypothetical protein